MKFFRSKYFSNAYWKSLVLDAGEEPKPAVPHEPIQWWAPPYGRFEKSLKEVLAEYRVKRKRQEDDDLVMELYARMML